MPQAIFITFVFIIVFAFISNWATLRAQRRRQRIGNKIINRVLEEQEVNN